MSETCISCGQTTLGAYDFHVLELVVDEGAFEAERTLCGTCLGELLDGVDAELGEVFVDT